MHTKAILNSVNTTESSNLFTGRVFSNPDDKLLQKNIYKDQPLSEPFSFSKSDSDFTGIPLFSKQLNENDKDNFSGMSQMNNSSLITASNFYSDHGYQSNTSNPGKKKLAVTEDENSVNQSGPVAHAISASGSGTVATTYTPEATDKSSKIVFIQVMRELLDGSAVKPSVAAPSFAYQDADTTADFYHVDYVSGEKDPYYNGDDPQDFGPQGNAIATPPVAASTSDTPNFNDGSFPAGKTKLAWEFSTAAFSAAGADAGTYYGTVDWAYAKEKGKAGTTAIGSTKGTPGSKFEDAVKLFNSNHGFTLPAKGGGGAAAGGSGAATGALIGGGVGALAGAGIGFAAGGPIGALIGGLIGLGVGAVAGGLIGSK